MTFKQLLTGAGFAALLASAGLGATSCSKTFIDLNDPTRIPTAEGYKDSLSILGGVTAAYGGLQDIYGKGGSNNGLFVFAEIPSDNSTAVNSGQRLQEFDLFSLISDNPRIQSQWSVTYRTIARCNIVLSRIGGIRLTAATRNRYVAEAKFIRALSYFNAVRIWGAVPLVKTEIASIADAYAFGRAPVTEVYQLIEQDLTDAIADLPVAYGNAELGRATQGAAKGLLGKVYLTEKKYGPAAGVLKEVIDGNAYALQPVYANIFLTSNEMNSEILFAVRYAKGALGIGSPFANSFAILPAQVGGVGTSDMFNFPTTGLIDAFTASGTTDVRGTASYGLAAVGGVQTGFTKKYTDVPTSGGDADNDWIVLRYADVLLMYAEAVNEQGSVTAPALDAVNRVIRRSRGLPVATPNTATDLTPAIGTAGLRARLETERRLELNFEGHRWFDLVRTDRAIAVMNDFFVRYNILNAGAPRTIDAHNLLFPLPLQELQTNPGLTQNAGY